MANYLIVGASSGIGKSLAEKLNVDQNHVYGTFFSQTKTSHDSINYFQYDALESMEVNSLPDVIDGFAYCPGAIKLKPFARLSSKDFTEDFEFQVGGAIRSIQSILPRLKKSDHGSIVLFSSVAAQYGFNYHSLISTSKGAIEGLSKALAAEFSPRIRVNCIAPSLTQTPLAENLLNSEEKISANGDRHPLKRVGQPNDIASMAAFLLSKESGWITGQTIFIDGGISNLKV